MIYFRVILTRLVFIFFSITYSSAQTKISGFVKDVSNSPIEKANIVVSGSKNQILSYTYTKPDGSYFINLETNSNPYIVISANSLGFQKIADTVHLSPYQKKIIVSFNLEEQLEQLDEVVLKSTEKISSNDNVTTVRVEAFTNGAEQTVEDILKNLPGIEVLIDGSIKAHGKFIDKLLIENEDIFNNNYKILSKNLDAIVLKSVQIIDNYEDNPILAKVRESEKVALNLVLKEKYKNIWFGNLNNGIGNKDRIKASANVGLIRKDIKFFDFIDYNNLGKKASAQLKDTPSSINFNTSYQEEKIEKNVQPIFSIDNKESNLFNEEHSTFNKAFINSLGFVTNIKSKVKLRGTGYFTNDAQNELFSSETIFNIDENPIHYNENNNISRKNPISGGDLEIRFTKNQNMFLKNVMIYNNKPETINNQLLFNNNNIIQNLKKGNRSFHNHFNFSYLLKSKSVIHNYLYFGNNKIIQKNDIVSPTLNNFLSINEDSQINNNSNDKVRVIGGKSTLLSNIGKYNSSLELGYESLKETRNNNFRVSNENYNYSIDSLQNRLTFNQQTLQLKTSLSYPLSEKVEISTEIAIDYLDIKTKYSKISKWLINPKIILYLKKTKIGFIRLSYNRNYDDLESILFLNNFQLKSYQSFKKGLKNIHLQKKDILGFYYQLNNELKTQSLSVRTHYTLSNGIYTTDNQIGENIILSSYRFVNIGNKLSTNINLTSYFKKLALSTNIGTSQVWSSLPIKANTSEFKDLKTYSSSYFLTGTTYFNFPVNFGFKLNLSNNESQFNNSKSKFQWKNTDLNITYKLSKFWIATINNNSYWIDNLDYHFITLNLNHTPETSKFSYKLVLNNLTNENNFSTVNIDEYSTYRSNLRLLPRYVFFLVKYRF